MRILFIYPNKVMATRMPLGIGYLSSYVKKCGHEVKVFDATFIKCGDITSDEELRESSLQVRNPDLKQYGLIEKNVNVYIELGKELESFKPDIIAMSVVDPNYNFGLNLLRYIKKKNKDMITIIGGPTASFAPEVVIKEDCIDYLCVGEGEEAFLEFCNRIASRDDIRDVRNIWAKKDGKIYRNNVRPLQDINEILMPDWDIFDSRHLIRPLGGFAYRMGIFSMTRGCLFRCKYCSNCRISEINKGKGSTYRIKRPDSMVKEIATYKEKYDLNFVFFTDDLFPLHSKNMLNEFCALYKECVGLPFSVSLHPELVKEEQFSKLISAGCCNICVGLESGDSWIRKEILGRIYKDEDVMRVFALSRKYNIRSSSFNMIGLPYETRKSIFRTIELNRKSRPSTTTLTFFHPYYGTELRDLCIKEGFFDPTKEREYETVYREESHLNLSSISKKDLRGLFRTFQLYFKLPKMFYGLIYIVEKEYFLAKPVFFILKKIFYWITRNESKWDFTKSKNEKKLVENLSLNRRHNA